jgi:hypothetical protein
MALSAPHGADSAGISKIAAQTVTNLGILNSSFVEQKTSDKVLSPSPYCPNSHWKTENLSASVFCTTGDSFVALIVRRSDVAQL